MLCDAVLVTTTFGRTRVFVNVCVTAALPLAIICLLVVGCDKQEQEGPEVIRPVKMMTIGAATAGGVREFPGQVRAAEEIELELQSVKNTNRISIIGGRPRTVRVELEPEALALGKAGEGGAVIRPAPS